MKALLWKDYRLNRVLVWLGVVLLVAPMAIPAVVVMTDQWPSPEWQQVTGAIWAGSFFSLVLSQFTLCLLGGNLFAAERADRSAEFLAYLPPSRARIATSKALIAFLAAAVCWGVALSVKVFAVPETGGAMTVWTDGAVRLVAALSTLSFGTAWLASTMLESPTFAVTAGMSSTILVALTINLMRNYTGRPADVVGTLVVLGFSLGVGAFIAGVIYFLHRVEP